MVVAVLFRFHHVHQQAGQIISIGGRTNLIVNHANFIMGLAHIHHSLNKVFPVQPKYPGNAHDKILFQCPDHCQFTFQLSLPVYIQRFVILIIRLPGSCTLPIKHIIRRKIQEFRIYSFGCLSHVQSAVCIHLAYQGYLVIIFCHVHGCPGRTVNHGIRFYFCKHSSYYFLICYIHTDVRHCSYSRTVRHAFISRRKIRTNTFIAAFRQFIHHVMAQLAINTGNKDSHTKPLF